MHDADELQQVESAEGDERDAFGGFLAPEGDGLRNEEESVDDEAEAEEDGDDFFHDQVAGLGTLAGLAELVRRDGG